MIDRLYHQAEIRDRTGKMIKRLRRRRSRSYVRQWSDIVLEEVSAVARAITDRTGSAQTTSAAIWNMVMAGAAGNDDRGVIFGTDDTAVDISDYDLGAAIAEGTGAGQLQHQLTAFSAVSVAGDESSFTISRVAVNGSGSSITVKEIGLAFEASCVAGQKFFLAVRDVLSSSLAVPDGGAITAVYTIKVVV